ncbi:hypothetical protein DBV15_01067 [Temnothorax longispinosus]|uniref:Uncharacterized protein n=1 Tax=Temnothorax longispinosus TaxID=300112 RepID=A0A4S2JA10_9HYME|nr:hypothetical protein DBV15_01067 [Temnothorax longispinosus]
MTVPVPVITETINRKTRIGSGACDIPLHRDATRTQCKRTRDPQSRRCHKYEKESSESTMRVNGHSEQSARQEMGKTDALSHNKTELSAHPVLSLITIYRLRSVANGACLLEFHEIPRLLLCLRFLYIHQRIPSRIAYRRITARLSRKTLISVSRREIALRQTRDCLLKPFSSSSQWHGVARRHLNHLDYLDRIDRGLSSWSRSDSNVGAAARKTHVLYEQRHDGVELGVPHEGRT